MLLIIIIASAMEKQTVLLLRVLYRLLILIFIPLSRRHLRSILPYITLELFRVA